MPESRVVRRAGDRYRTTGEGTDTSHAFSYGKHYDPDNVGFGPIMAINEERLAPGAGYDDHHHGDAEIVTWVVVGALDHLDSTGQHGTVGPGLAQRLSAGAGVTHAERNASATEPLRFVQMMLRSRNDGDPQYAQVEVPDGPGVHETVAVNAEARLLVARPDPDPVEVTGPALIHVTRGRISVAGHVLEPGDELRTDEAIVLSITAEEPAEALVWLV